MNSIYIGHGAPLNAIWQTPYRNNLVNFAKDHEKPEAIVVVSAHFERNIPLQITSSERPGIIYDYYGFPEEMYELQYDSPGNPKLAKQLASYLQKAGRAPSLNPHQGLDHGAWIPLSIMYPDANIPIIQLSIPIPRNPEEVFKIGQIVAPLRDQGIMFMGSGNLVHNLPHTFSRMQAFGKGLDGFREMPVENWAMDFDASLKEHLDDHKIDQLLYARNNLEYFHAAAPTTEHFDPLYFVLGTMSDDEGVSYIHEGFEGGSISMRSFVSQN